MSRTGRTSRHVLASAERVEGGTVTRALHDAFGSDDHAVQLLEVTANAKGRTHTWQAVVVFHVRDGRFSEGWITVRDLHAVDDLDSVAGRLV